MMQSGGYQTWRGRGKAGISTQIGAGIQRDIRIHDDGIMNFGGISALATGPMGCGKTTYWLQTAMSVGSINSGMSKEDYQSNFPLDPETVIWRGRRYDYWNSLIESNWIRSFPESPIRRHVCVHVHENDELGFFALGEPRTELEFDGNELSFLTYRDAKDLYSHLIHGAHNVVYEPITYFLKTEVVAELVKATLQDLRLARLKRKKPGRPRKDEPPPDPADDVIQAPSSTFWFEFLETVMQIKKREEFFSVFIDEAHQVVKMNPPGELFHLGNWFANSMIDFRRNNVSLFLASHDAQLLDYRIVDRTLYFFWMPGARVYPRISRVKQPLPDALVKGEVIGEESRRRFGLIKFDAIPYQPPVVYAEGLKSST